MMHCKKTISLFAILFMSTAMADLNIVKIEGPCELTQQQRNTAWDNVTKAIVEKYPEISEYCEMDLVPGVNTFIVVDDVCRTHVACEKTVDGALIMHGDFLVEVDEDTQKVKNIYSVPW